jgi:hypothetical protein
MEINMKNNILTYNRDSKFGFSRMIATMAIFFICCLKIVLNTPHQSLKVAFSLAGAGILLLIGKTLREMIAKYENLRNITPKESIPRLLLTLAFGTVLIMNFTPVYQVLVGSVIILLLVTRFIYK